MNGKKALGIATIGHFEANVKDTPFKWVLPWRWDWDHQVWSFFKPIVEGVAIALFFYLHYRWAAPVDRDLAVTAWGIVLPLGLAGLMTWTNIFCWIAGPDHEKEAFYAAAASQALVAAAWNAHNHATEEQSAALRAAAESFRQTPVQGDAFPMPPQMRPR